MTQSRGPEIRLANGALRLRAQGLRANSAAIVAKSIASSRLLGLEVDFDGQEQQSWEFDQTPAEEDGRTLPKSQLEFPLLEHLTGPRSGIRFATR